MNIAIFGASGATGIPLTKRCLAAGHSVTALVRTPQAFSLRDAVRVVHGSAFDADAVHRTIAGADAVLSTLGASSLGKEEVLERGVPQIIAAMQQQVRRIIVLGAAGAIPHGWDDQSPWRRWIAEHIVVGMILKNPMASQHVQYQALAASDLDWTMVMPPMLTNGPGHGAWRVGAQSLPRNANRIAREDVAEFMLQQLDNPRWIKKAVYIAW